MVMFWIFDNHLCEYQENEYWKPSVLGWVQFAGGKVNKEGREIWKVDVDEGNQSPRNMIEQQDHPNR